MFVIKKQQIRQFDVVSIPTFLPRIARYLANTCPSKTNILGMDGLRPLVVESVAVAKAAGLVESFEVCLFIDLMMRFGKGFQDDPCLPDMMRVFHSARGDTRKKIEKLYVHAIEYETRVGITDTYFPSSVFSKMQSSNYGDTEREIKGKEEHFKSFLNDLWPEKYNTLQPQGLQAILEKGNVKAKQYKLSNTGEARYLTLLMYLLGHDFDTDLQYGWLHSVLKGDEYDDSFHRMCNLHFTTQEYYKLINRDNP